MRRPLIWWRVIAGLVVLPFVPWIVVLLEAAVIQGQPLRQAELIGSVTVVLMFTAPAAILFGPLFIVLYRRLGVEGVLPFVAGGAVAGGLTPLTMALLDGFASVPWPFVLYSAGLGGISAVVLRYIIYAGLSHEEPP